MEKINPQPEGRSLRMRDGLIMALTLSSGAIAAISYFALGKIFTAFMTGNFVFLGLLAAGSGTQSLVSLVVSIALLAAGVYLATRIIGPQEARARGPAGRRLRSASRRSRRLVSLPSG